METARPQKGTDPRPNGSILYTHRLTDAQADKQTERQGDSQTAFFSALEPFGNPLFSILSLWNVFHRDERNPNYFPSLLTIIYASHGLFCHSAGSVPESNPLVPSLASSPGTAPGAWPRPLSGTTARGESGRRCPTRPGTGCSVVAGWKCRAGTEA